MYRVRHGYSILGLLLGTILLSSESEAQFTTNFQTNVISGVTSNWTGNYIVGDTTSADVLLIENDGGLTNDIGFVAYDASSSNNAVVVSGVGAHWVNQTALVIGQFGSGNSLVVSDGGMIINGIAVLGNQFGSRNNTALVTGSGSVWSNQGRIAIGPSSDTGNSLAITNGGTVVNDDAYVGGATSSVTVSGTGSLWKCRGAVRLGFGDSQSNRVIVSEGAVLTSGAGLIGYGDVSHDNTVLITDAGSVWSNQFDIVVGSSGNGNSLAISNGAVVETGVGKLGEGRISSNNIVVVTGNTSAWIIRSDLIIGDGSNSNRLLVVDGATVIAGRVVVGSDTNSVGNRVTVTDASITVTNVFDLSLGTLVLSNGLVTAASVMVGAAGAVEGDGSILGSLSDAGTLMPDFLMVTGNVTMTSSALTVMGLARTNEFSRLEIGGALAAGGILKITTSHGLQPVDGDTFRIFEFASATGAFDFIALPGLGPGLTWDTSGLLTNGVIRVVPGEPPPPCVITCPDDILVPAPTNECEGATVFYSPPVVSGNCPPVVCSPPSGSFLLAGMHTINCTTIGISACSFTITVADVDPPTITCPSDISTNIAAEVGSAAVSFSFATTDNCGLTAAHCVPPSGTGFTPGTNSVICTAIDAAGNSNACAFNVVVVDLSTLEPHDLKLLGIHAPKNVKLKVGGPLSTRLVKVQIQNLGPTGETIGDFAALANLVTVNVANLRGGCAPPSANLIRGSPNKVPLTLKPKGKLNVSFEVTFDADCVPDTMKGPGHEDFSYTAAVHLDALDGKPDTVPGNNACPRSPNYLTGDKGCGGKNPDKTLGADVATDVVIQ